MLAPLLSGSCHEDAAFIVLQDGLRDDMLDMLIDAVREESGRKISKVIKTVELKPGQVYFLSRDHRFHFEKTPVRLSPESQEAPFDLDILLNSAIDSGIPCAVVALSGFLREGKLALQNLVAHGCEIWGSQIQQTPIPDLVNDLQTAKLLTGQDQLKVLLEQVKFKSSGAKA